MAILRKTQLPKMQLSSIGHLPSLPALTPDLPAASARLPFAYTHTSNPDWLHALKSISDFGSAFCQLCYNINNCNS